MTTIDARDLEVISGGILDQRAAGAALSRPSDLSLPKLPAPQLQRPPGTIPLGPYYPPSTNPDIA